MNSWWLSFADADLPKGTQFLGAAIVVSASELGAVLEAHARGCNPGGDVALMPIPAEFDPRIPDRFRNRLLTKAECDELEPMLVAPAN